MRQAIVMSPDDVRAMRGAFETLRLRQLSCVLTRLCELRSSALSLSTDNCKRIFDEVYSSTLHKGKLAARRGRKASGPNVHRFRIAGLPARGFSNASAVILSASLSFPRFFRTLVRTSHCDARRCCTINACCDAHWLGKGVIEKGKPVERRGRKASGLRDFHPTTAGSPKMSCATSIRGRRVRHSRRGFAADSLSSICTGRWRTDADIGCVIACYETSTRSGAKSGRYRTSCPGAAVIQVQR